jgi:uncharacterized protein YukE
MNKAEANKSIEYLDKKAGELRQRIKDAEAQKQEINNRIEKVCQLWETNKDIELPGQYDKLVNEQSQCGKRIIQYKMMVAQFEKEVERIKKEVE